MKLANSNIVNANKRDSSSHQTHIAIVGDSTEMFYSYQQMGQMNTSNIDYFDISIVRSNLCHLAHRLYKYNMELIDGVVTVGKRTQHQVQFSKRGRENSKCQNELRDNLYEDDLLFIIKEQSIKKILYIWYPAKNVWK